MKKEEFRKLLGDNFEEITREEWNKYDNQGEMTAFCEEERLFFKPKQKFPIVFENDGRRIEVYSNGNIEIHNLNSKNYIRLNESLDLLYKAVEKSKELRKEVYFEEDVKEFIKELKEEILKEETFILNCIECGETFDRNNLISFIDEKTGDKLK